MRTELDASDPMEGRDPEPRGVIRPRTLLATLAALLLLVGAQLAAAYVDLGPRAGLFIGLILAAVQALLVCGVFMRPWLDERLHVTVFLGALLAGFAFAAITVLDVSSYQHEVRASELDALPVLPIDPAAASAAPEKRDQTVHVPATPGPRTSPTSHDRYLR